MPLGPKSFWLTIFVVYFPLILSVSILPGFNIFTGEGFLLIELKLQSISVLSIDHPFSLQRRHQSPPEQETRKRTRQNIDKKFFILNPLFEQLTVLVDYRIGGFSKVTDMRLLGSPIAITKGICMASTTSPTGHPISHLSDGEFWLSMATTPWPSIYVERSRRA